MKIDVKNLSGKTVGSLELDDAVWGADVNEHLLWEVVKWQRAKKRAGTHSTRTVADVRGTGKKPYRQKGTGNARQGSTRAHQMVGGGRAFGPKPRDYEYAIPKKVKKGALRSALSLRAGEQKLVVLDTFELPAAKTKEVARALDSLGVQTALIVDLDENTGLARSARNLSWAKWIAPEGLNVYDVLDHETLIVTSESAKRIEAALKPRTKEAA
jgi:large subunit ribosomal protein L4